MKAESDCFVLTSAPALVARPRGRLHIPRSSPVPAYDRR